MSMNIPPHIPQVIVNSAMPATESLAKANAIKEVVPPTVQAEAIVPQKSREQDVRPPVNNPSSSTYEDIQLKRPDAEIIPESDEQQQDESAADEESNSADTSSEQAKQSDTADGESKPSESSDDSQAKQQESQEKEQEQVEQQQIQQLQQRDVEVKAHEQAHAAIGGSHAGTPNYEYETGPNGKKYAVGGEVSIDVSKEATPEATIRKMQTVQAAALAPAEPSSQDRKVAAQAASNIAEAKVEAVKQNAETAESKSDTTKAEDTETDDLKVNASETEKVASDNESGVTTASSSNDVELPNTMSLAKDVEQENNSPVFESKTAQVISSRYANASTPHQQGFSAVA
ncbi:hypothetical protein GCM10008107_30540 [Psychrosphaera saromensis]|uniref:Catalase n=1 Tax=Psychrosphaera saromensis TaxID=716813 RepID=A0A2S7UTN8_9GAMM|nr:putative metalloprotease CJM1_0395 family protein [Psychrosphaera saromensis]PQJ52892.1 hypothetical protein BTO11_03975 [Psychrosphaera saromensis]GHB78881.1 hypothetical protein GCM10008107_30540 [Psychrosphaera saromensis]GLQ14652.1 hypothetical protein GCM10007917_21070 [Psychrosphaera saromensis]